MKLNINDKELASNDKKLDSIYAKKLVEIQE
jgi:hypothetical protein